MVVAAAATAAAAAATAVATPPTATPAALTGELTDQCIIIEILLSVEQWLPRMTEIFTSVSTQML